MNFEKEDVGLAISRSQSKSRGINMMVWCPSIKFIGVLINLITFPWDKGNL